MTASAHTSHTLRELATILEETAHAVETLGASLCSDYTLMEKHIDALQGLDLICQTIHQVSTVLKHDQTPHDFEHIRLETLRKRIEKAQAA